MSLNENVSLYVSDVPLHEEAGTGDTATTPGQSPTSDSDSDQDHSSEEECVTTPHRKIRRLGEDTLSHALVVDKAPTPPAALVDECPAELKTLRYKIMLMNGNTPVVVSPPPAKNSYENLQLFLEKEKNNNNKENWSKLNRSVKNKKVSEFVDNYANANELTEEEHLRLLEMLKQNMGRGKLTKNKEVTYDKTKGIIKEMPCLIFNKVTRHFTIKNMDAAAKHSGTIKKAPGAKGSGGGGGGGSGS